MKRTWLLLVLAMLLALPCAALGEEVAFDFSALTVEDPSATPVAVDPIDKPTPTPLPEPNYWYETY